MVMQIVFGDYYNDGHGLYECEIIEVDSTAEKVKQTLKEIENEFCPCSDYENRHFTYDELMYLKDNNYPLDRLLELIEYDFDITTWDDISMDNIDGLYFNISAIIDIMLFLLAHRMKLPILKRDKKDLILCHAGYGALE